MDQEEKERLARKTLKKHGYTKKQIEEILKLTFKEKKLPNVKRK